MFKIDKVYNDERDYIVSKNNKIVEQIDKIKSSNITDNGDTISHLSNCIVSIEPYKFNEAMYLFGSKHKTLFANKISIYEALVNKKQTKIISKGKVLLEFLISDEELSTALINHNASFSPISFLSMDGYNFDISNINKEKTSLELLVDDLSMTTNNRKESILEYIQALKKGLKGKRVSKKKVLSNLNSLKNLISYLYEDSKFSVHELDNAINKDYNSVVFELNNTINKLLSYQNVKYLEFNHVKEDNNSLLFNYANGFFSPTENELYFSILDDIYHDINNGKSNLPKETVDKITEIYDNYNKACLGLKSNLSDKKALKREKDSITNGTLSFHKVSNVKDLANSINTSGNALEMRIGLAAKKSKDTISSELFPYRELIRINFNINDLMLLVRSSEDSFVLGTIIRFAGESVPLIKFSNKNDFDINSNENTLSVDPTVNLKKSCKKLERDIDSDNFKDALNEVLIIENSLDDVIKLLTELTIGSFYKTNDDLKNKLKETLKLKFDGLPEQAIKDSVKLLK